MKWFTIFIKILIGIMIYPITMIILLIYYMKKLLEWLFNPEKNK